jgi:hypothetical protein
MAGVADSRPRGRQGRSYRFYSGAPLWPFGFSGSYTTWELEWAERLPAELSVATLQGGVGLAVALRNSGRVSSAKALRAAAKLIDYFSAVCCTSVTF